MDLDGSLTSCQGIIWSKGRENTVKISLPPFKNNLCHCSIIIICSGHIYLTSGNALTLLFGGGQGGGCKGADHEAVSKNDVRRREARYTTATPAMDTEYDYLTIINTKVNRQYQVRQVIEHTDCGLRHEVRR